MKFRLWLKKLHLYLALIAAIPVLILCLSGTILVFKEFIDERLTREYMSVEVGEKKLPISEMVERLQKEIPAKTYAGVVFPPKEGLSYYFWMKETDYWTVAYINPYTGQYKGTRDWYDKSWANLIWWVTELHSSFQAGKFGGYLVAVSTVCLFLSALSGIYLWWPRKLRFHRRQFVPKIAKRWKQTAFNIHGPVGFFASFFIFAVTLTGAGLFFHEELGKALEVATSSELPTDPLEKLAVPNQKFLEPEILIEKAKAVLRDNYNIEPDLQSMRFATPENVIVEFGFQGALEYASAAHSHVWLDGQTGELIGVETASNMSSAARIQSWVAPIHYGTWGEILGEKGDWVSRALWVLAACSPILLMISGFSIVKRRSFRPFVG